MMSNINFEFGTVPLTHRFKSQNRFQYMLKEYILGMPRIPPVPGHNVHHDLTVAIVWSRKLSRPLWSERTDTLHEVKRCESSRLARLLGIYLWWKCHKWVTLNCDIFYHSFKVPYLPAAHIICFKKERCWPSNKGRKHWLNIKNKNRQNVSQTG